MKKCISIYLVSILTIVACNNNENKSTDNKVETHKAESLNLSNNSRQTIIDELKQLKQKITSNKKETIADVFEFPKPNSTFSVFIDDTTYFEKVKVNYDNVSKDIFLQYYNEISPNIWLDKINYLLQNIKIDSLKYKDNLEINDYKEKESCYFTYRLEVEKNKMTLRMKGNSNHNYKSNKKNSYEIEKNASEYCEHHFWWTFSFDGAKLHFIRFDGAD